MLVHTISLTLTHVAGEELTTPVYASCKIQKLIGDCSAYNIGFVQANYASSEDRTLALKLLAHKIVCDLHLRRNSEKKTWSNKYLFTNLPDRFRPSQHVSGEFYEIMKSMSPHDEIVNSTYGWHGGDYEMRTIVMPKCYKDQKDLGIKWKGITASVECYDAQHKSLQDEKYTRLLPLKDLVAQW